MRRAFGCDFERGDAAEVRERKQMRVLTAVAGSNEAARCGEVDLLRSLRERGDASREAAWGE